MMNISLTPRLEGYVKQKVSTGLYNSSSEVIREGLRLLEERDSMKDFFSESEKYPEKSSWAVQKGC